MKVRTWLAPGRKSFTRLPRSAVLAGLAGVVVVAAGIAAPYAFQPHLLGSEIAAQIQATAGLTVTTRGDVGFRLLPRPHIVAVGLRVTDPTETIAIEADELRGDVRLLPLLVGRAELTAVTLFRPKLTIDLDGLPMRSDNIIGRAISAPSDARESRLGTLTLVDGTANLKGKRFPHAPSFSAIDVTLDWPSLGSAAALTGSLTMDRTAADIAGWVADPANLMRGGQSAVTVSLHAAPLDLNASGDVVRTHNTTFRGHVSASTPSVPELMTFSGIRFPAPAHLANVSLNSDATLSVDDESNTALDLANMRFHLDGNDFEGSLAFQSGETPLFSGTLACDQLNLAPLLKALPAMTDERHQWSRAPIEVAQGRPVDLDLRISAGHMRAASFSVDDAALSIMTRDYRTEVGLIEGKAYGGTVRGRISIGVDDGGVSLRGAGSLEDVDAATLSWDAAGRQLATGTVAATATLETHGMTPAALVANLNGTTRAQTRDGELSTIDLAGVLRGKGFPIQPLSVWSGRTPFRSLVVGAHITGGIATVDEGALQGLDTDTNLRGIVDLTNRRVDLTARGTAPADLAATLEGSFDNVVVVSGAQNTR